MATPSRAHRPDLPGQEGFAAARQPGFVPAHAPRLTARQNDRAKIHNPDASLDSARTRALTALRPVMDPRTDTNSVPIRNRDVSDNKSRKAAMPVNLARYLTRIWGQCIHSLIHPVFENGDCSVGLFAIYGE
jgi:hypothetical protein